MIREGTVGLDEALFDEVRAEIATGAAAKGAFHCRGCGYGVTVHSRLPRCPMCGGESWVEAPWSPLSRALAGRSEAE